MRSTILSKLLFILLLLVLVPLVIVAILGVNAARDISSQAAADAETMGEASLASAREIGEVAVTNSKESLQALAQESIEVRTVDLGKRIADFLYERDADALAARALARDEETYAAYIASKKRSIVYGDDIVEKSLYKELAFYGLDGEELVKVTAPGYDGEEYALDDWMLRSASLGEGDLYVSRLWGDYVYKSEAYAGVENPEGKRYEGYFRWVTPVYDGGVKIGYLSLKLDARHVMELAQHVQPTEARFVVHPDAPSGNYAYLVDDEGWLIMHAREYHLKGVLPDGTLPPPLSKDEGAAPILEDTTPLRFGYLSGFSEELDEIHTVHAQQGESGSQTYPWAGLDKWIAYSTVPYYTGSNYADVAGFGWVAIGAQIDKFNEPADMTAATITEKTDDQAEKIEESLDATKARIDQRVSDVVNRNMVLILVIIAVVVIVGILFAQTLSRPIRQLTDAAKQVNDGDFDVKLPKTKGKDEVAQLTASMEMLVAGLRMRQDGDKHVKKKK